MAHTKKRILLKLTGEAFLAADKKTLSPDTIQSIIKQMKQLMPNYLFGIVVGGGNFFRGKEEGYQLGMTPSSAHQVGILATMLNGIILKDLLAQHDIATTIFCAIECPPAGEPISQQGVIASVKKEQTTVFTGGTGDPFFTTDTNAVLRALQIQADEIWKGTKVDGVYDSDPMENPKAKRFNSLSYLDVLNRQLKFMDSAAISLCMDNDVPIVIFDMFKKGNIKRVVLGDGIVTRIG